MVGPAEEQDNKDYEYPSPMEEEAGNQTLDESATCRTPQCPHVALESTVICRLTLRKISQTFMLKPFTTTLAFLKLLTRRTTSYIYC